MIRLLLHNALRVDEACTANVADLGADAGHRVLRVTRKGARKAKVPLTPATGAALDTYLTDRAHRAGLGSPAQLAGPLLATATGGRLRQGHLWELVRRLARTAGIDTWQELSPHCLRHSAITFASREAGIPPKLMDERMGHEDGSVQSRYDHITLGMRQALIAALTEMWEESLNARRAMSPGSPVAALDALLQVPQ